MVCCAVRRRPVASGGGQSHYDKSWTRTLCPQNRLRPTTPSDARPIFDIKLTICNQDHTDSAWFFAVSLQVELVLIKQLLCRSLRPFEWFKVNDAVYRATTQHKFPLRRFIRFIHRRGEWLAWTHLGSCCTIRAAMFYTRCILRMVLVGASCRTSSV